VSGFDIIYALQDVDFDKSLNLKSVPVRLGRKNALYLSSFLHLLCAGFIIAAGYLLTQTPTFDWLTWLGTAVFVLMLAYQHTLVKVDDLSKINLAFFTTNGMASLILGLCVVVDSVV